MRSNQARIHVEKPEYKIDVARILGACKLDFGQMLKANMPLVEALPEASARSQSEPHHHTRPLSRCRLRIAKLPECHDKQIGAHTATVFQRHAKDASPSSEIASRRSNSSIDYARAKLDCRILEKGLAYTTTLRLASTRSLQRSQQRSQQPSFLQLWALEYTQDTDMSGSPAHVQAEEYLILWLAKMACHLLSHISQKGTSSEGVHAFYMSGGHTGARPAGTDSGPTSLHVLKSFETQQKPYSCLDFRVRACGPWFPTPFFATAAAFLPLAKLRVGDDQPLSVEDPNNMHLRNLVVSRDYFCRARRRLTHLALARFT
ncbi:hypothetical protein PG995_007639 [Apiospora arundinis]